MFSTSDTIVAIATPAGRGSIGVVRLSGPEAERIGRALAGRGEAFEPRHATVARILDHASADATPANERTRVSPRERSGDPGAPASERPPTREARSGETSPKPKAEAGVGGSAGAKPPGSILDLVVVTWFAAPHSYTGEDVIEIAAHGSPMLLDRIVQLAMTAGARLAEPGEFTFRAYLNGRLDLIQAEAVADLVNAVTPLQARVAMDQLEGTLTAALAKVDAALFDLCARLEASLDFPDEGFHFITREHAGEELRQVRGEVSRLIAHGRAGRVVREGRMVVLTGRPNAGKSSLFNALVGAARAIVTEIPGTTRDLLTEHVDINGLDITLVDTAGLREAGDAIEAEGVERALQAQRVAALTLRVVDGSVPRDPGDDPIALAADSTIVVLAKADLPRRREDIRTDGPVLEVSALTGEGLAELRAAIVHALTGAEDLRDTPRISNTRHLALLDDVQGLLNKAVQALGDGATEELVLADLTEARHAIEALTGRRTPDDLLQHIFAKFCVGK